MAWVKPRWLLCGPLQSLVRDRLINGSVIFRQQFCQDLLEAVLKPANSCLSVRSLNKERIKKSIYKTRDLARADIFDYIEMFYNPTRRHSHLGGQSPDAFEAASG